MNEKRNGFLLASERLGAKPAVPTPAPPLAVPAPILPPPPPPQAPPPPPTIVKVINEALPPTPQRFTLCARDGRFWSYPFAYVGLIELPTPGRLILHCNSREIEAVEVVGRGLDQIAKRLMAQQPTEIKEADRPEFVKAGPCVNSITVRYTAKKADEPEGSSAVEE